MNPIYSGMIVLTPLDNHSVKPDELVFLPLNEVTVDVTIHESIALVRMEQEFVSPDAAGQVIEVTYKFPKLPSSIISRLTVGVGDDRIIEAMIVEQLNAESRYDDAVPAGLVPNVVTLEDLVEELIGEIERFLRDRGTEDRGPIH